MTFLLSEDKVLFHCGLFCTYWCLLWNDFFSYASEVRRFVTWALPFSLSPPFVVILNPRSLRIPDTPWEDGRHSTEADWTESEFNIGFSPHTHYSSPLWHVIFLNLSLLSFSLVVLYTFPCQCRIVILKRKAPPFRHRLVVYLFIHMRMIQCEV